MNTLDDWAELCLRTMDDMSISSSTSLILIYNLEAFKDSPFSEGELEELVLSKLLLRKLKEDDEESNH